MRSGGRNEPPAVVRNVAGSLQRVADERLRQQRHRRQRSWLGVLRRGMARPLLLRWRLVWRCRRRSESARQTASPRDAARGTTHTAAGRAPRGEAFYSLRPTARRRRAAPLSCTLPIVRRVHRATTRTVRASSAGCVSALNVGFGPRRFRTLFSSRHGLAASRPDRTSPSCSPRRRAWACRSPCPDRSAGRSAAGSRSS